MIRNFMKQLVNDLTIGPDDTQIGVALFGKLAYFLILKLAPGPSFVGVLCHISFIPKCIVSLNLTLHLSPMCH